MAEKDQKQDRPPQTLWGKFMRWYREPIEADTEAHALEAALKSAITIMAIAVTVTIVAIVVHFLDELLKALGIALEQEYIPMTDQPVPSLSKDVLPVTHVGLFVLYIIIVVFDILELLIRRFRRLWSS